MQTTLANFREVESQNAFSLQNSKLLKVELNQVTIQFKLGSMVAIRATSPSSTPARRPRPHAQEGRLRRQLMKITGTGRCSADQAQDIHLIYLENDFMTPTGPTCWRCMFDWDIKRGQGVSSMMGGGLFNMSLQGTGWVAILSDGPPCGRVASAPTFADAQAVITWSSGVTTGIKTDVNLKTLMSAALGESVQMSFAVQGWVLVQLSEGRIQAATAQQGSSGGLGGLLNQ